MTQPIRQLMASIRQLATPENCLFTPADLRALVPDLSDTAFKTLLSRAASQEHLTRVCRGLYAYEPAKPDPSLLLYHAVSKLRPMSLNYLSLESVLSDAGVISQIPIQRITVMSSGRTTVIDCGRWGSIEFVRTRQGASDLQNHLHYDPRCRLWRASVAQALRDMRATRRNLDLVNWSIAHEFV